MKSIKEFKDCQIELNIQKYINEGDSYCIHFSEIDQDITEELKVDDDGNCISRIWEGSNGIRVNQDC